MIDKDTKMFGSFSSKAGSQGCLRFNTAFRYYNYNAIYKSFSVTDVKDIMEATRVCDFSGFAISMPFKRQILDHVDFVNDSVREIGAANTITRIDGKYVAHNTDCIAILEYLSELFKSGERFHKVAYLGAGGYAAAFEYVIPRFLHPRNGQLHQITRDNWTDIYGLKDYFVFNCTPVEDLEKLLDPSNRFVDCIASTKSGMRLSMLQAKEQFKLYTGLDYPLVF